MENKLTHQSFIREEDDVLDLSTDSQEDESDLDVDIEEPADDWNKAEPDDSAQYEKEPSRRDVAEPESYGDELELRNLIDQRDEIVALYTSGKIKDIPRYKELIKDIPAQIRKLQAKLKPTVSLSNDDDEIDDNI